jgi:hypothetical protein
MHKGYYLKYSMRGNEKFVSGNDCFVILKPGGGVIDLRPGSMIFTGFCRLFNTILSISLLMLFISSVILRNCVFGVLLHINLCGDLIKEVFDDVLLAVVIDFSDCFSLLCDL